MKTLALLLNRDELLLSLGILGCSGMSGLGETPLAGMTTEQVEEHLASAEGSLAARGLMGLQQNHALHLDEGLVALVGVCARPTASLLLAQTPPHGQVRARYFNAIPEMLVEQHSPDEGLFSFEQVPTAGSLRRRLRHLLQPMLGPEPSAANGRVTLRSEAFLNCMVMVREGHLDAASEALVAQGLPARAAGTLARDLDRSPTWLGAIAWDLDSPEPKYGETVTVIQGKERCWLAVPAADSPEHVTLRKAAGKECVAALLALLKPLEQTLKVPA